MTEPGRLVDRLSALLGTVVAAGPGGVRGRALAALGDTGPVTVPARGEEAAVDGDLEGPAVHRISGLLHVVLPLGARRLDVLVPEPAIHQVGADVLVDGDWLERVRLVAASLALAAHEGLDGPPDWSRVHLDQTLHREESVRRYSLTLERAIDRYIRDGDEQALVRHLASRPIEQNVAELADGDRLRGMKNLVISILAVATRSALGAGTDVPMAFGISDFFIREIERSRTVPDVVQVLLRALRALSDAAASSRRRGSSALVRACEDYVYLHLDEDLRAGTVAAALGVSRAYLSAQFRREVGHSLAEYVHARKVEEARTMLTHTTLSPAEICVRLNFYDQSHFIRIFRRVTGETPQRYRVRTRADPG